METFLAHAAQSAALLLGKQLRGQLPLSQEYDYCDVSCQSFRGYVKTPPDVNMAGLCPRGGNCEMQIMGARLVRAYMVPKIINSASSVLKRFGKYEGLQRVWSAPAPAEVIASTNAAQAVTIQKGREDQRVCGRKRDCKCENSTCSSLTQCRSQL